MSSNTQWRTWPTAAHPWDHPRSRGEHIADLIKGELGAGPSPLARGAQERDARNAAEAGTIPARAGSTPAGARG